MKNIHIIPTGKPIKTKGDLVKDKYEDIHIFTKNDGKEYGKTTTKLNIYITNDEKIKEGDNVILKSGRLTKAEVQNGTLGFKTIDGIAFLYFQESDKKVILTTDQELIKDGIQAIDDEFLEWFVKNPSCEEVDINYENYKKGVGLMTSTWRRSEDDKYKIIIPKEEPKFVTVNIESAKGEDLGKVTYIPLPNIDYIPKQETLEEADEIGKFAEKRYLEKLDNFQKVDFKDGVFEGAKWQQKQLTLSDEEIDKIAKEHILYNDFKRQWFIEGMKMYRDKIKINK